MSAQQPSYVTRSDLLKTIDEQILELDKKVSELKRKPKDGWDKASIVFAGLMPFAIAIQRTKHTVLELTTSKLFCDCFLTHRANVPLQTLAQIIFFTFRHCHSPLSKRV